MATVTSLTADRMLEIEGASIIDAEIVNGDLILTKHDGTTLNAGPVLGPPGPIGPQGPAAVSAIPGEVKQWSGEDLPSPGTFGNWVWADGAYYPVADYPVAADHISDKWRTFAGASDPGAANFRVPDMRGLSASGLDAMPGGTRANRMTRAVAITMAARTGKETHAITIGEMAGHAHGGATGSGVSGAADRSLQGSTSADGNHNHVPAAGADFAQADGQSTTAGGANRQTVVGRVGSTNYAGQHSHTTYTPDHLHGVPSLAIGAEGGNVAHENVQPTVFVPYIVYLG